MKKLGWYKNINDTERAKILAFVLGYLQAETERTPSNSKDLQSEYNKKFALKLMNLMEDFATSFKDN